MISVSRFGHKRIKPANFLFQRWRRVDFFTAVFEIIIPSLFFPTLLGDILSKKYGVEKVLWKLGFLLKGNLYFLGNIELGVGCPAKCGSASGGNTHKLNSKPMPSLGSSSSQHPLPG